MTKIHISGYPSCGKTSLCLFFSKIALNDNKMVFWLTGSELNPERFSQIMRDIPLVKASKFHSLSFRGENDLNDVFKEAVIKVISMANQLKSTKLIVIDGWDEGLEFHSKASRINMISQLAEEIDKDIEIYITSQSYQDAGNSSKNDIIRQRNKIEEIGFESWLIMKKEDGIARTIKKTNSEIDFKIEEQGVVFIN